MPLRPASLLFEEWGKPRFALILANSYPNYGQNLG